MSSSRHHSSSSSGSGSVRSSGSSSDQTDCAGLLTSRGCWRSAALQQQSLILFHEPFPLPVIGYANAVLGHACTLVHVACATVFTGLPCLLQVCSHASMFLMLFWL
jgi:hypothetical protein